MSVLNRTKCCLHCVSASICLNDNHRISIRKLNSNTNLTLHTQFSHHPQTIHSTLTPSSHCTLSSHTILTQYTQFSNHPHTIHSVLIPSSHCTLSSYSILTLHTQFSNYPYSLEQSLLWRLVPGSVEDRKAAHTQLSHLSHTKELDSKHSCGGLKSLHLHFVNSPAKYYPYLFCVIHIIHLN